MENNQSIVLFLLETFQQSETEVLLSGYSRVTKNPKTTSSWENLLMRSKVCHGQTGKTDTLETSLGLQGF